MPKRRKSLISPELHGDPLAQLASGECVALESYHLPGRTVLTIAMALSDVDKDAVLSSDYIGHYILSDVDHALTLTAGSDYDIDVCQECTLGLVIDTGVSVLARKGIKVKAKLKPHGDGSCGSATVYIH